jgi:hypothetical protein
MDYYDSLLLLPLPPLPLPLPLLDLDPAARMVARSPFTQYFTIHGCCCTSSREMRFSGSSTSSYVRVSRVSDGFQWAHNLRA